MINVNKIIKETFNDDQISIKLIKKDFRAKVFKIHNYCTGKIYWLKFWGDTDYNHGDVEIDFLITAKRQLSSTSGVEFPKLYSYDKSNKYLITENFNGIYLKEKLIKNDSSLNIPSIRNNIHQWFRLFHGADFPRVKRDGLNILVSFNNNRNTFSGTQCNVIQRTLKMIESKLHFLNDVKKVNVHTDYNSSNILINGNNDICVLDFTGIETGTIYEDISFLCVSLYCLQCGSLNAKRNSSLLLKGVESIIMEMDNRFNENIMSIEFYNSVLTKLRYSYNSLNRANSIIRWVTALNRIVFFRYILKSAIKQNLYLK